MIQDRTGLTANRLLINIMILANVVILRHALIADKNWYRMLIISLPLLLVSAFIAAKKIKNKK